MSGYKPSELDAACYQHEVAKAALDAAKRRVEETEKRVLSLVRTREEGAAVTDGEHYKVTATGKLTRTFEPAMLDEVYANVPLDVFESIVKPGKPTLDLKSWRALEAHGNPDIVACFQRAIITKPAKTALKVERVNGD